MSTDEHNLCILLADVHNRTRLHEKLGEAETARAMGRCQNRIMRAAEGYAGRVVRTIGDELMCVFASADMALHAACEMQQRVDSLPPASGVSLSIRVGMHFGAAAEQNGTFFGEAVDVAARLLRSAHQAQILTTGDTVQCLSAPLQVTVRQIDLPANDIARSLPSVFEVHWHDAADLAARAVRTLHDPKPARLRVIHGTDEFVVDTTRLALSLGRDAASDIVIHDRRASRHHGRIERRADGFVLVDLSTNGTFVSIDGKPEFPVWHQEVVLIGRGYIRFGHAQEHDQADIVTIEIAA